MKKNKQKYNEICIGHNHAQTNTHNLNHDTWLTVANICVRHLHGYVLSSFPLVVKKYTTIPEYPSSARSPHAMALKQLTSILFTKLKDGYNRMTSIDRNIL
jgi:hypothetical protein